MNNKGRKERRRRRELWEEAKREALARVRAEIALGPDEVVPDEVLLAEVDHYLPEFSPGGVPNHAIGSREQWFGFRLIGMADTECERASMAKRLKHHTTGRIPLGLIGSSRSSRRSQVAGQRRNQRRSRSN